MVLALVTGSVLGVFLLHPVTMAIYWVEFHADLAAEQSSLWRFIGERMEASFSMHMVPMTVLFAGLGGLIGSIHATVDARLRRSKRAISYLEQAITQDLPTLIRLGENEHAEFKSTARWDVRQGKVNKALTDVPAKTIAAFANHDGGSLIIGVDDDGEIVGLELDYNTLKKPNRDGFAQLIMTLVRERLGGHVCRLIHVLFVESDGRDVCRIVVESASEPVYFADGPHARFFVRTGNASRELDARETVHYVAARWGGSPTRTR